MIARCRLLVPNWRVVYISLIKTTTPFSLPSSGSLAAIRRRGGFNQIESIYIMYWYTVKSINDFFTGSIRFVGMQLFSWIQFYD